jgi:hypothetical protein
MKFYVSLSTHHVTYVFAAKQLYIKFLREGRPYCTLIFRKVLSFVLYAYVLHLFCVSDQIVFTKNTFFSFLFQVSFLPCHSSGYCSSLLQQRDAIAGIITVDGRKCKC